jgi:hypothetical protein
MFLTSHPHDITAAANQTAAPPTHISANLRDQLEAAENAKRAKKVSNIEDIMFYFIILLLSHECCVLLSTRQQIPHFHPLLTHDRDLQEREGQERDGESSFYLQCL